MTENKPILAWQKWEDAMNIDLIEEPDEDESDDLFDDKLEYGPNMPMFKTTKPSLVTPMGIIPIPEYNPDNFNFWLGHTNFHITHPIKQILNTVPGIESLEIYTPYRMRVGIAKLFKPREVMHQIGMAVSGYLNSNTYNSNRPNNNLANNNLSNNNLSNNGNQNALFNDTVDR